MANSHNGPYSHLIVLSPTAPKTSGGSLQLVDGQIALTKEKAATANGALIVPDLQGASKKDKFSIQVGTGRKSDAGNITNKNMKTVPFSKEDIVDVTFSAAKDPVLSSVTLGYNGVQGTGLSLKEKQATTLSLRLTGDSIGFLGFNNSQVDLQFSIFAGNPSDCVNCAEPCSSVSCKDITTNLVSRIRNHELRPGSSAGTGASVKVGDIIDVIPNFSCVPTKTPTATYTTYSLTVLDGGKQEDLAVVAAQYPTYVVTRASYTGITSVYEIQKPTGSPTAFAPVTPNQLLLDCACPNGYTAADGGFVYTIQADDAGVNISSTLIDSVAGVSDNAGAIYTTSYTTSAAGLTNGSNVGVTGTASGSGTGATFTVTVAGNVVTAVTLTAEGSGYVVGETITILGSALTGGTTPADDIVVTVVSLEAYAQSIDKTQSNFGVGTYVVVFDTQLNSTQEAAILAKNQSYTLYFEGEATSICVPNAQPSTIAWVAGESCTVSTQQYYIDLKDDDCGVSKLADLQAAYPDLTITLDSETVHTNCRQRYLTTVTSTVVCEGCETPEYIFEAPADYGFESWHVVPIGEAGLTSFTTAATTSITGMTTTAKSITLTTGQTGVTYTGDGAGAVITVASSTATTVDSITLTSSGTGYEIGDEITIDLSSAISGSETGTIVLTVTGVNGEYPTDCECGITFKAKQGELCPPATLTNNGAGYQSIKAFTPKGVKIQVSAGESPTVLLEGYKYVTTPFKVTYDTRHFEGTGWGVNFMRPELASWEYFLGTSHPRNYAEGWFSGFETKLEPCSQYDTITVNIQRDNYAGTQSRRVKENIRYIFAFDSGRLCDYVDFFNALGGSFNCPA